MSILKSSSFFKLAVEPAYYFINPYILDAVLIVAYECALKSVSGICSQNIIEDKPVALYFCFMQTLRHVS